MSGAGGSDGLQMQVYTSPTRVIAGDRTFSPVTSTLFTSGGEGVLVDAQYYVDDVQALGDMVAASGVRLNIIYVTHGHSDHYFGAGVIAARHPGAEVVALPSVVDYVNANHDGEVKTLQATFGDRAVKPTVLPSALQNDCLKLGPHILRAISVGQGDIAPSTALHAAELDAVIPGDIVYNGVHMMLGLTGPEEWAGWSRSLDAIEALRPKVVVAGHKRPELPDDEPARMLDESRAYIRDFAEAAASDPAPNAIISAMRGKYPDFGNVTTLVFSAHAAAKRLTVRS